MSGLWSVSGRAVERRGGSAVWRVWLCGVPVPSCGAAVRLQVARETARDDTGGVHPSDQCRSGRLESEVWRCCSRRACRVLWS